MASGTPSLPKLMICVATPAAVLRQGSRSSADYAPQRNPSPNPEANLTPTICAWSRLSTTNIPCVASHAVYALMPERACLTIGTSQGQRAAASLCSSVKGSCSAISVANSLEAITVTKS
jgi:hypothetical protein